MIAPILCSIAFLISCRKYPIPTNIHESVFFSDIFRESQFSGKAGKYLGLGLVVIGCIMIFDKIVLPQIAILFNYEIREYFRTGIIALLFIAGGIKLMTGSKENRFPDRLTVKRR
jgi:hypothetical protein